MHEKVLWLNDIVNKYMAMYRDNVSISNPDYEIGFKNIGRNLTGSLNFKLYLTPSGLVEKRERVVDKVRMKNILLENKRIDPAKYQNIIGFYDLNENRFLELYNDLQPKKIPA